MENLVFFGLGLKLFFECFAREKLFNFTNWLHTQINAKLWGILSALGRGNTLKPEKVQNLLRDLLNKGRL